MVAEEQRTSKAEAERRVREATEEANRRRHDALTEAQARLQDAADEANRRVRRGHGRSDAPDEHASVRSRRCGRCASRSRTSCARRPTLISNATPALEPIAEEQAAVQSGLVGSDADHTWPVADARTQETSAPAKDAKATANPHTQATTTQAIANAPTRRTTPVTQPKPAAQQPAAQPTRG